jgi:hypothetical protein
MNKLDILLMAGTVICALFAWRELGTARMKALYLHSQNEAPGHWLLMLWWAFWALVFVIWWFIR